MVEELDSIVGELGNVDEDVGRRVTVDEGVGHEERAALGVEDVHCADMLKTAADADSFLGCLDKILVLGIYTGNHGVCRTCLDHHETEVVAVEHLLVILVVCRSLTTLLVNHDLGELRAASLLAVVAQVDNLDARKVNVVLGGNLGELLLVAEKDRLAETLAVCLGGSLEHVDVVSLAEHDAARILTSHVVEAAEHLIVETHEAAELLLIGVPVLNMLARHATLHSGLCDSRGDGRKETGVESLRHDIVATEADALHAVCSIDDIGDGLARKLGDGLDGGNLHLLVDGASADVECATEDIWEAEDVVDLVGAVGATRREYDVGTACHGILIGDLRLGVRESEDDRVFSHRAHHVLRKDACDRETKEDVGILDCLGERIDVARGGELALLLRKTRAVHLDGALRVDHDDVLTTDAEFLVKPRAGYCGRTCSVDDNLNVLNLLADDLESVDKSCGGDDGGAVLVVVHDGDVELGFEPRLNLEALGRLDVLKVYAAEGWGYGLDGLDELVWVFLVDLDVEDVDACEYLEQEALTLHDGLAAHGTDVAETEDCRAVGDDGYKVSFVGIFIRSLGVFLDFEARLSDARGVGE